MLCYNRRYNIYIYIYIITYVIVCICHTECICDAITEVRCITYAYWVYVHCMKTHVLYYNISTLYSICMFSLCVLQLRYSVCVCMCMCVCVCVCVYFVYYNSSTLYSIAYAWFFFLSVFIRWTPGDTDFRELMCREYKIRCREFIFTGVCLFFLMSSFFFGVSSCSRRTVTLIFEHS